MKDNCERIFKEAARYARMPDEAIADHFKTSIKDENKKIKILRGEIEGMPVAFPVLEKDSYVGEGSFGVVSMYRELISHKLLSIKLLNDGLDNSSEEMRSCRKTRTSLAHCFLGDSIVMNRGIGQLEGNVVECLDYVPGKNLHEFLEYDAPSVQEEVFLAYDIAKGLEDLHNRNLIYRDLKPKNIIVSKIKKNKSYKATIIDLGLIINLKNYKEKIEAKTSPYGSMGSTPPEAFLFDNPTSEKEFKKMALAYDAYSFGITLAKMFGYKIWMPQSDGTCLSFDNTRYTFEGRSFEKDLIAALKRNEKILIDFKDNTPKEIIGIIEGLTHLDWHERLTVNEAKAAIGRLL